MILSAAMALRHSLNLTDEANAIEDAVDRVLVDGLRTADIADGRAFIGTEGMGAAVAAKIRS
jgi:3-isopropylmalate dehydrogenase